MVWQWLVSKKKGIWSSLCSSNGILSLCCAINRQQPAKYRIEKIQHPRTQNRKSSFHHHPFVAILTTKPLGTAVINRQPPSGALGAACTERSCHITGHSYFAQAIKVKVASLKWQNGGQQSLHTHSDDKPVYHQCQNQISSLPMPMKQTPWPHFIWVHLTPLPLVFSPLRKHCSFQNLLGLLVRSKWATRFIHSYWKQNS